MALHTVRTWLEVEGNASQVCVGTFKLSQSIVIWIVLLCVSAIHRLRPRVNAVTRLLFNGPDELILLAMWQAVYMQCLLAES